MADGVTPIQISPAVVAATDVSCAEQLERLKKRDAPVVALDTTYSSRGWHANEITTLARDADAGMLPLRLVAGHHPQCALQALAKEEL
jgi:hypothetical protein